MRRMIVALLLSVALIAGTVGTAAANSPCIVGCNGPE